MTNLTPLGPMDLHARLVGSPFFLDVAGHLGDNIVATFQGLAAANKLTAQDKRDLFECCLYLSLANTLGVGDQARGRLLALVQANPKFKFRSPQ